MREIKFRAWHSEMEEMFLSSNNPDIYESREFYPFSFYIGSKREWYLRDFEMMQYTQYQDKNLNDIFGADIIQIDRYDEPLIGVVRQLDGGQWYIDHPKVHMKYMHQIHCEACDTDSPVFFINFFESYELEIIGNIYENPELLDAK